MIPVASDTLQFSCSKCGMCCKNIKGLVPEHDKDFLREFVFGKLPIVQVVDIDDMTFPLWDWEAARFKKWASERGIEADIKPLRVVFDLLTNRSIVVSYYVKSEDGACPFLNNDNKCSIYDTLRAYTCRMFPLNKGTFLRESDQRDQNAHEGLFGSCGAMEKILPHVPEERDALVSFLQKTFSEGELHHAMQHDHIIEWVNKTIVGLMQEKKVRPAMNYPYAFLLKRVVNSEKIDLTDFLVECGAYSSDEIAEMISGFDENRDAIKQLEKQINDK